MFSLCAEGKWGHFQWGCGKMTATGASTGALQCHQQRVPQARTPPCLPRAFWGMGIWQCQPPYRKLERARLVIWPFTPKVLKCPKATGVPTKETEDLPGALIFWSVAFSFFSLCTWAKLDLFSCSATKSSPYAYGLDHNSPFV